jgi:hypothetical protein
VRDVSRNTFVGAFQISSARKEGSPIPDADLEEFATNRIPEGVRLVEVAYGSFSASQHVSRRTRWCGGNGGSEPGG